MLPTTQQAVKALRDQVAELVGQQRPSWETVGSGCSALDRFLPAGGWRRGTIVEFLSAPGSGAASLALVAARQSCSPETTLVVIDRQRCFYPLPAVALGIDLGQVVVVRPAGQKDYVWSLNQSLACPGVGAVLSWPEKLDDKAFRALQLAAETSGAIGLLVRPLAARGHPTWSDLQLLVEAIPAAQSTRHLSVSLLRCRYGSAAASIALELDDETGLIQESCFVHLASPVGSATAASSSAGA